MKIAVAGCFGRMGQTVCEAVQNAGHELAGGTEKSDCPRVGTPLGSGIVTADARAVFEKVDAVIDFTSPATSVENALLAAETGKILIIGTTGLTAEQTAVLAKAGQKTRLVFSSNMSVGVNLLLALVEKAAAVLNGYDAEIVEMHHRNKADAPSGTALSLGKAVAAGRNAAFDEKARFDRRGIIGKRPDGEIGFAVLRGGDVTGDHTVIFAGNGERVELTHKASSRVVFADGAVRAAEWAAGQKNGLYSMRDVLGF